MERIEVRHLFKPLDDLLIQLLEQIDPEDWHKPTVAKLWTVKDVVGHLLDGNIRTLSIQRDRHFGETPPQINGYTDLVNWLNGLNADWIKANKRISPELLILLHKATNDATTKYYESLDPDAEAIFPVSWAGEEQSLNWMHLAREYTEKWHHQQQIREAVGRDGILTREFFYPMINTFFRALPFTFRDVDKIDGTVIKVTIPGETGGDRYLQKQAKGWVLVDTAEARSITASVNIPAYITWKLFSKSVRPADVMQDVVLTGDERLAVKVLEMVSVMA